MTDKNTFVLQSCTVRLTAGHTLCNETSVQCHDDSNAVISIKIEQEEPVAISFSSIKDEPDVSESTDISVMCRIAVSLQKLPIAVAFVVVSARYCGMPGIATTANKFLVKVTKFLRGRNELVYLRFVTTSFHLSGQLCHFAWLHSHAVLCTVYPSPNILSCCMCVQFGHKV
jgi:hypothetical protein